MSTPSQATQRRTETRSANQTLRYLPRNFWLGVASGVAFNLYTAILSVELVMTWFLSQLTDSNLLISLLVPINVGSWYFFQVLLSGYVERRPRSLPLYRWMSVVRALTMGLLAVSAFLLEDRQTLLLAFLALYTTNCVASGIAALPFLDVIAKTIPPTRRGMFYGWRKFLGGLLGLASGVLVNAILAPDFRLGFPDKYGLLFLVGFISTVIFASTFSLIDEPPDKRRPQKAHNFIEQMRRGLRLPAQDRGYRRYLGLRVAISVAICAWPFHAVYARRALNASENIVGIYLIAYTLSSVSSNLISGKVGDRWGNRWLMRVAGLTAMLPSTLALTIVHVPSLGLDKVLAFAIVFIFQGFHQTARVIGGHNYIIEFAPEGERPTYIGFSNGLAGLALFLSPLAGTIVDQFGFVPLFILSSACGLTATLLSVVLEEPRASLPSAK